MWDNAQLEAIRQGRETILVPHGTSTAYKNNAEWLISFCAVNSMSIGNTFFQNKLVHKKIAKLYGIPEKYINIFKNMYLNSSCCIRTNSGYTDYFNIMTGVRKCCIISPMLFRLTIDFVMRQATSDPQHGIPWNTRCLADFDFADDLALLGESA